MPFDFEEYKNKCATLSPEELQKEWENYTRHIAGGATSTAGSVLFAPFTAGASLVGLGLSTPRIHNARKKRAIIEEQLQAHGTTHHTRKRDVVAPMAVAGTIGGLTLGFAGAGADLLGGQAAEKGMEYFVSHAALEVAGSTLEHKHDEGKKIKDQLELARLYGPEAAERLNNEQKTSLLSPPTPLRKTKSETHLDGLAYGSLPGEKKPKKPSKPTRPPEISEPAVANLLPPSKTSGSTNQELSLSARAESTPQAPQKENHIGSSSAPIGINMPSPDLLDHDEAERRGLRWDSSRGIYVQAGIQGAPTKEKLPASEISLPTNKDVPQPGSDELEDLLSELLIETSGALGGTDAAKVPQIATESTDDSPTPLSTSTPALLSDEKAPILPPRPQSFVLPPRPKSSIGNYTTPVSEPARPQLYSYVPPPPSLQSSTPNIQHAVVIPQPPRYSAQNVYNPQQYSPSPTLTPALLATQIPYQPIHIQFPQYQHYPPPPPSPGRIPPPPARRPGPQPLQQYQSNQGRQDSTSSISTVSSTSTIHSNASTSTVSALSTPLTSYSTSATLTPVKSESLVLDNLTSPGPISAKLCASPAPVAANMYFPPPPTASTGGSEGEKKWGRGYFP